jgi:hypothetical protein
MAIAGASWMGTRAAIKAIRPPQNAICAKAMSRVGVQRTQQIAATEAAVGGELTFRLAISTEWLL